MISRGHCSWLGAFAPLMFAGCTTPNTAPNPTATPTSRIGAGRVIQHRIVEVVAGPESTCARTAAGRVACLGSGMAYSEPQPLVDTHKPRVVRVPPSRGISAGEGFACSVDRDDGKVRCWGDNSEGQLGRESPGNVDQWPREVPGLEGIEEIVTHGDTTCARREATLWCWPEGDDRGVVEHPLQGRTPARALFEHARLRRALTLDEDFGSSDKASVDRPWGSFLEGGCSFSDPKPSSPTEDENEDELYDDDPYPDQRCDPDVKFEPGMEVGLRQGCLIDSGHLRCESGVRLGPEQLPNLDGVGPIADFAVGSEHVCVLAEDGELACWGASLRGQIGLAPTHSRPPTRVATEVAQVWVTRGATCFETRSGRVACSNAAEDVCAAPDFVPLSGPSGIREMFDAEPARGCIVDTQGAIWCAATEAWIEYVPSAKLAGTPASRRQFTARDNTLCWLADGRPTCAEWTTPRLRRELEFIREEERLRPQSVRTTVIPEPEPIGKPFAPFDAVSDAVELEWINEFLCARTGANALHCLEAKSTYGAQSLQWTPVRVPTKPIVDISSSGWVLAGGVPERVWGLFNPTREHEHQQIQSYGEAPPNGAEATHTSYDCSLLTTGEVLCGRDLPELSEVRAKTLVGTEHHTCAIDDDDSLWCWGDATGGRLGVGDPICSRHPRSLTAALHDAWEADR